MLLWGTRRCQAGRDGHEAESVALLICCETLGLDGAEFCRGYIQHWLKTEKEIPNQSAARIFAIATSILKAGAAAVGSQ